MRDPRPRARRRLAVLAERHRRLRDRAGMPRRTPGRPARSTTATATTCWSGWPASWPTPSSGRRRHRRDLREAAGGPRQVVADRRRRTGAGRDEALRPSVVPGVLVGLELQDRAGASGDPGIPVVGLPDCTYVMPEELREASPIAPGVTYDTLREAGVPVPNSYRLPGLPRPAGEHPRRAAGDQARPGRGHRLPVRDVHRPGAATSGRGWTTRRATSGSASTGRRRTGSRRATSRGSPTSVTCCPARSSARACAAVRRSSTSTRRRRGEQWWCEPDNRAKPTTWTCKDPRVLGGAVGAELPTWAKWPKLAPVSHAHFVRWKARMYNDARGWDAYIGSPETVDAVEAESEPVDAARHLGQLDARGGRRLRPGRHRLDEQRLLGLHPDLPRVAVPRLLPQGAGRPRSALGRLLRHPADPAGRRAQRRAGGRAQPQGPALLAGGERSTASRRPRSATSPRPTCRSTRPRCRRTAGRLGTVVQQPVSTRGSASALPLAVGGSNYTDTPHARVERLDRGTVAAVRRRLRRGAGEARDAHARGPAARRARPVPLRLDGDLRGLRLRHRPHLRRRRAAQPGAGRDLPLRGDRLRPWPGAGRQSPTRCAASGTRPDGCSPTR